MTAQTITEPLTYDAAVALVLVDARRGGDTDSSDEDLLAEYRDTVDLDYVAQMVDDEDDEARMLAIATQIVCTPWHERTVEKMGRQPDFVNWDSAGHHAVWMGNDGVLISITEGPGTYGPGEYIYQPFTPSLDVDLATLEPIVPTEYTAYETPKTGTPFKVTVSQKPDGKVWVIVDDQEDSHMGVAIPADEWDALRVIGSGTDVA